MGMSLKVSNLTKGDRDKIMPRGAQPEEGWKAPRMGSGLLPNEVCDVPSCPTSWSYNIFSRRCSVHAFHVWFYLHLVYISSLYDCNCVTVHESFKLVKACLYFGGLEFDSADNFNSHSGGSALGKVIPNMETDKLDAA